MPTHGSVAKSVRESKDRHPEAYCPNPRCLWRVRDRDGEYIGPCGNHGDLRTPEEREADGE